jgi:signal transduction histidine kinase
MGAQEHSPAGDAGRERPLSSATAGAAWAAVRPVLHQLTSQMPNAAIFVVDADMRFIFADGLALAAAGIDGPYLVGKLLFEALDPSLAMIYEPDYRRLLAGETFEREHMTHARFYSSRGIPLRDDTGEVYAALVCTFDITERHSAEVRREERARVLLEVDRQKDEFLYALGHELRNPLAAINNGVRLATLQCGSEASVRNTLEMMQRQLRHVIRLVEDLQDLAHVRSGAIELHPQRVPLQEVVRQSVEASLAAVERHEHTLEVESQEEGLMVMADRDRLAQVFTNLLVNSCKYSYQGGLIHLQVGREGNEAIVRVSDTGVGIAAEDLGRIFDKFSQSKAHLSRAEGGFGFGLALVKKIVTLHGGTVSAESPGADQGSVFTVRLPLAR